MKKKRVKKDRKLAPRKPGITSIGASYGVSTSISPQLLFAKLTPTDMTREIYLDAGEVQELIAWLRRYRCWRVTKGVR